MVKKMLTGVPLLLALLCLTACATTSSGLPASSTQLPTPSFESTPEPTVEPTATPEPTVEPTATPKNGIGDTATLGNWEITFASCEILDKIKSSQFTSFNADEGNKYIVVTLKAKNTGTSADTFLPSFSMGNDVRAKLMYQDTYEFSSANLLGYSEDLHDKHLNPLSSAEGVITFQVAEDAATLDGLTLILSAGKSSLEFNCQ